MYIAPNKIQAYVTVLGLACLAFMPQWTLAQSQSATLKPVAKLVHARMDGQAPALTRLFTSKSNALNAESAKIVADATEATVDPAALRALVAENAPTISLQIPFEGTTMTVDLVQTALMTTDFAAKTSAGQVLNYEGGRYYRGIVQGDDESIAAVSFFKDDIIGVVSTKQHGNIVIGKLQTPNNKNQYILYSDRNLLIHPDFNCGSKDEAVGKLGHQLNEATVAAAAAAVTGCVRVYFELDFGTYTFFQNNTTNAINYITGAFNNVAAIYANEQISTTLSATKVWTTQDPYSTNAGTALDQFSVGVPNFTGDLGHLVSLRTGSSFSGVAYLYTQLPYSALCTADKYAYSQTSSSFNNLPAYSWTVNVLTHEMGHNMGSRHTQSCLWPGGAIDGCVPVEDGTCTRPALGALGSGTIMSYCHQVQAVGITFANGFGLLPGNLIRNEMSIKAGANGCLAATCANAVCSTPTGVTASNLATTTATIGWTTTGAASYKVQYRVAGTAAWTTVPTATISAALSGLTPNTTYDVQVIGVCSATNESTASTIVQFKTLALPCNVPTNVVVSNITTTSGIVGWTATGAASYKVQYRLFSPAAVTAGWTTVPSNTNSIALSGLTATTTYEIQVIAVCSATSESNPSTIVQFTTLTPVCNAPTNVVATNLTSTGATITWTASGAGSYTTQYRLASSAPSGTWLTANSATLVGLTPNTAYQVQVIGVCGAIESAPSTIVTFTTASVAGCNPPTTITITSNVAIGVFLTWNATGALSYRVQYRLTGTTNWKEKTTLTNSTSLTGLFGSTAYEVRVISVCSASQSEPSSPISFTVANSTCITPTTVLTATSPNSITVLWSLPFPTVIVQYRINGTNADWSEKVVSNTTGTLLTGLAGNTEYQVRVIEFCSPTVTGAPSAIKTIKTTGGTCTSVGTITISGTTPTGTTLSWATTGATSYMVEYRFPNAASWTIAQPISNALTKTLSGLSPSTDYQVRVTAVCGVTSAAPTVTTFATSACPTPQGLAVVASSITDTRATASWNTTGAASYTVQYRVKNAANWIPTTLVDLQKTFTGLTPGTDYEVQVLSNCGVAGSTPSSIVSFKTAPTCPIVGQLSFTALTTNSVTVSWNSVGVPTYKVRYRPIATATNWNETTAATNRIVLNGLVAGTLYDLQVSTICGTFESISSVGSFTTLCIAPVVTIGAVTDAQVTFSWTAVTGATNYRIEYLLPNNTWTFWGNKATASTVTIQSLLPNTNYSVRVITDCGSTGIATFKTNAVAACTNNFEPNNTLLQSTLLAPNTNVNSMIATLGDLDYYKFTTTTAAPKVRLTLHSPATVYNLFLYNANGVQIGSLVSQSTGDKTFLINGFTATSYYVLVTGYPYNTYSNTTCYNLKLETSATNAVTSSSNSTESVLVSVPTDAASLAVEAIPNPAIDQVVLRTTVVESGNYEIRLTDLMGRTLQTEHQWMEAGLQEHPLNLGKIISGCYFVRLKNGQQQTTTKLIVR
jgi:hypothetical protein